jgi:hypothetical protein
MPMPICAMRCCTLVAPLMALAAFTASDASARAATDCIAAPKGTVPQGSHWYYRWDREGQRKCWYVAPLKDRTARDTTRVKPAPARPPVRQASIADQRVSDTSPATWSDEAAQQSKEDRIRRLLYGTEQLVYMTEQQLKDEPVEVELRPSLVPVQTADAGASARHPMSATSALQSMPADAPDEVTRDTFVPGSTIVAAQTGTAVAPAQMALYLIAILAISGGLLHASVKLVRARQRRIRIERRSAYLLPASRPAQRALPPDRIRRFA